MKSVLTISKKVSATEVLVKDAVGREKRLISTTPYKVGDSVLVENGIILMKTKKEAVRTYVV